ncbi:MAG: S26 family signal peptidase, partial [Fibrobacterota bacterium]
MSQKDSFIEIGKHEEKSRDRRLFFLEIFETVVFAFAVVALINVFVAGFFVFDFKKINSMEGELESGDRLVVLKAPYGPGIPFTEKNLPFLGSPRAGELFIVSYPDSSASKTVLRCAGSPGQRLYISDKRVILDDEMLPGYGMEKNRRSPVLSPDVIPRDNLSEIIVPAIGDSLVLESADIFTMLYYKNIIQSENPDARVSYKPLLLIGGDTVREFSLKEMKTHLDDYSEITPENTDLISLSNIFRYIRSSSEADVYATVRILFNEDPLDYYFVRRNYYFFISDNWDKGYDSRYFGFLSG